MDGSMGELVDLSPYLAEQRLCDAVSTLRDQSRTVAVPPPEELGWMVIERDELGRPLRYLQAKYRAIIGYVPGNPEMTFLDYRNHCRAYDLPLDELALGLENGFLPPPLVEEPLGSSPDEEIDPFAGDLRSG